MKKRLILVLVIAGILSFCSSPDSQGDKIDNICGQEPCFEGPFEPPWVSAYDSGIEFRDQFGIKLTCDNKVLETENVLTFSDASSDRVKIQFAEMTEISLAEIKQLFQIKTSAELGIVDFHSKFTIYSNRYKDHNQSALLFGFILYSLDSPYWGAKPEEPDFIPWYHRMVKHETTHVIQYSLCDGWSNVDIWFAEGLAEWVSEDLPVTTWEQVEEWHQDPDHVNPISIHKAADYPLPLTQIIEYYPLFGLAIQFLMDKKGWGKNVMDIKNMFLDIGQGMVFAHAFELHLDMNLKYYEENFFQLIKEYLPAACKDGS